MVTAERRTSDLGDLDHSLVKSQVTNVDLVHRRRGQIVEAAVELFSSGGYYRTTIQQIARHAGVSIGLIYQYARTKEDILLLSLLSVLDSYKKEIPPAIQGAGDPLGRLWAAVDAYCRVVDRNKEATVLAYRSTKSLPDRHRELVKASETETNKLISRCLTECIERGFIRDINIELVTYQLVSFAHLWALKYWRLGKLISIDDYITQGLDVYFRGILTASGTRRYQRLTESSAAPGSETEPRKPKAISRTKKRAAD